MTDTTARPEVDDPRVLALAKARQQLAYENPFNAVCPPWDGLTEQEQRLSLLDARSYLHAALRAGLVPASAVVPAADRAALRDRIAALFRHPPGVERLGDATPGEIADAVLGMLFGPIPAGTDVATWTAIRAIQLMNEAGRQRDAVLTEVADRYQGFLDNADTSADPRYWTGIRDMVLGLRHIAVESAAVDRVTAETPPAETKTAAVARHTCHDQKSAPGHAWECQRCSTLPDDIRPAATPGPAVEAQPGKDTETRRIVCVRGTAEPGAQAWAGATELASDREIAVRAATGLVGYRQGNGSLLHCLAHKPAPASRWADFHEVTAEDLEDGGICVHPRCGRDLLARWPAAVPPAGGAQQPKEA
jgi:hypothetical protein